MADGRRLREAGKVAVGDRHGAVEGLGISAQPRAQHHDNIVFGASRALGQHTRGVFESGSEIAHSAVSGHAAPIRRLARCRRLSVSALLW